MAFYYFKGGLNYPILVNSSASQFNVSFRNNNEPLRPRIVATGDPDALLLLWSSSSSQQPTLKWGLSSGVYSTVVAAETSHVNRSSICGAPGNSYGWRDLGLLHSARLEGLSSLPLSARIYYVFGDAADGLFSQETVFLTPPPAGQQPANRSTTLALYCDLGRGSLDMTYTWNEYGRPSITTTMAVGQRVLDGQLDAVFHGGDISYATGYMAVWDFFLDQIAPIAGGALYLTTVGNHESDWPDSPSYYTGTDSGGECGVAATLLLPMPQPASTNKPWWSYDVGLFHIVGMSTEHNFTVNSPQWLWLQQDLQAVNRSLTPWVLLNGHRAMYINSDYGGSASSDIAVMDLLIQQVEPLLWQHRVNLAFYGHNHAVQRQTAVLNKTVVQTSFAEVDGLTGAVTHLHRDPQATVHMVVGTGGAAFTVNYVTPYPAWSEMVMYEYGYAIVSSVNESYLDWSWFSSTSGALLDHMVITQSTNWSQPWVLPEAASATSPATSGTGSSSLSGMWVAVLVCGAAALLAVLVGAAWLWRRRLCLGSIGDEEDLLTPRGPPEADSETVIIT